MTNRQPRGEEERARSLAVAAQPGIRSIENVLDGDWLGCFEREARDCLCDVQAMRELIANTYEAATAELTADSETLRRIDNYILQGGGISLDDVQDIRQIAFEKFLSRIDRFRQAKGVFSRSDELPIEKNFYGAFQFYIFKVKHKLFETRKKRGDPGTVCGGVDDGYTTGRANRPQLIESIPDPVNIEEVVVLGLDTDCAGRVIRALAPPTTRDLSHEAQFMNARNQDTILSIVQQSTHNTCAAMLGGDNWKPTQIIGRSFKRVLPNLKDDARSQRVVRWAPHVAYGVVSVLESAKTRVDCQSVQIDRAVIAWRGYEVLRVAHNMIGCLGGWEVSEKRVSALAIWSTDLSASLCSGADFSGAQLPLAQRRMDQHLTEALRKIRSPHRSFEHSPMEDAWKRRDEPLANALIALHDALVVVVEGDSHD